MIAKYVMLVWYIFKCIHQISIFMSLHLGKAWRSVRRPSTRWPKKVANRIEVNRKRNLAGPRIRDCTRRYIIPTASRREGKKIRYHLRTRSRSFENPSYLRCKSRSAILSQSSRKHVMTLTSGRRRTWTSIKVDIYIHSKKLLPLVKSKMYPDQVYLIYFKWNLVKKKLDSIIIWQVYYIFN